MIFIRIKLTNHSLRVLRILQISMALTAIAIVGFDTYKLCAVLAGMHNARAELKQTKASIVKLQSQRTLDNAGMADLTVIEPASEYTKFISTFIRQINRLAKDSGCSLKSVRPSPSNEVKSDDTGTVKYRLVPVEIDMASDYNSAEKFIDGLSELPKLVKLDQIQIDRESVVKTTHRVKLSTKLKMVLYLIEPSGSTM